MRQLFQRGPLALPLLSLALCAAEASAAKVQGSVARPPRRAVGAALGYVRPRVAAPAPVDDRRDLALFLAGEESLPLPPPPPPPEVRVHGLAVSPEVVACAVDGKIVFVNGESSPIRLTVGPTDLGEVPPGERRTYECVADGAAGELRAVKVAGWRHLRAAVFVGEVGVAGALAPDGSFSISAPEGRYKLRVVTDDGVALERPVAVKADVDLGALQLEGAVDAAQAAGEK
jgi:hypothetical protein